MYIPGHWLYIIINADTLYYLIQTKSWKGICYRIINIKNRPAAYFFNKLFMQIWSVVLCITYFLSIYGGNVLFLWTSRWIISRLTVLLSMNIMQSRYLLLLLITSWNNGNTVSFSILWMNSLKIQQISNSRSILDIRNNIYFTRTFSLYSIISIKIFSKTWFSVSTHKW